MAPLRGWGERGKRIEADVPHGHWQTQTFIAALRHDRVEAPWVLKGPINGESFHAYVEAELIATLKPGDIVVMDPGSHKGKAVRDLIRSIGAKLLFLPQYSPDLNPIEQFFAKLKHWLRHAGARSLDELTAAMKDILERLTPEECKNLSFLSWPALRNVSDQRARPLPWTAVVGPPCHATGGTCLRSKSTTPTSGAWHAS